jgi:hypothetical protein
MDWLKFELGKIAHRRTMLLLVCFYVVALPVIVNSLSAFDENGTEGSYFDDIVFGFFRLTLLYLFLPLWIIIFTGLELRNGHAHRVIFLRSRNYYFVSKIIFSAVTAGLFALLGIITLAIGEMNSPYPFLDIQFTVYIKVFTQGFITFFLYSLFLTALVLLIRNVVGTFVVYYAWLMVENIIFLIGKKNGIVLSYLPIHLLNGLYAKNGVVSNGNYLMMFDQWQGSYLGALLIVLTMLAIAYSFFTRSSLSSISD